MIKIKNSFQKEYLFAIMFAILLVAILLPMAIAPNIVGNNYKNVTINTYVNITNSKPEVVNITIYEATNITNRNITISAGSFKTVYCNATVRDWNGFNDIVNASGILWHQINSTENSSDDNNTHYTNLSCTLNGSLSTYIGWFACAFDVWYYANNGTWNCSVNISDNDNKTGRGINTTLFYPVYALNVTDGIDYGNVEVEGLSAPDRTANVTNLGNMAINLTVEGYGARRGDGLAMNCSLNGNISVSSERFALTSGIPWASKVPLNSSAVSVTNLTMPKQTIHNTFIVNATYWELYVPPNPAGNCTGFIIFSAIAP